MTTAHPDLVRIVDTVTTVHGDNHPHLADVRKTFARLNARYDSLDAADPVEVKAELAQLRELSHNFQTPADGCEGYQLMDSRLEEFERDVLARLG
ncbi:hypothetical protein [Corynebacterium guangdongense]|uniref:Regulator of cell morphogenesis and NO signaling n=1 Tax=Corynebacterium guangdongense TaxID=1783348 RepID=A0ABU1ZVC2_9CORY|nr:hypothetical protein [Corynebacterium guangdongense]MDR7328877.1 regulator of cell morphogenesis and NO signaling [Corynebacterium guangdongense]WJZ17452.1 Iron-sulfur cluster repair protein ScdA [Corynebacterium guangdongense]